PPLLPVSIGGVSVEVVKTYKYLGVHLDSKLDWSANIDAIYKKGQSRLYFLRRLRSFNVCNKLLRMFYQSVVASVPFLCCGVLGRQHEEKGCRATRQAGEEGGSCCGHRTGLPHNGGGEKGPEVIIDDQLTFTDHIASVSRSCRFALFNIRKIRPYLTQYATQLLVQTLVNSRLDYCNALLTGLPACVVKPLQMIQNAAARLVFN